MHIMISPQRSKIAQPPCAIKIRYTWWIFDTWPQTSAEILKAFFRVLKL
jgi:hypothetical protein